MTFEELFYLGLDRNLPKLLTPPPGLSIGLGETGIRKTGYICLGLPDWRWPIDLIPADDDSVAIVHAYHFMEHLTGEEAIAMLQEIQRALMPGGIFQFCIPYYTASCAYQDLTHKSFWTEDNFKNLMNNKYYNPISNFKWRLKTHYLIIAGIVERNLCLLGQLVKE